MSRKGNSRHVKRLAASVYMGIKRKIKKYVAKPKPGRYTLKRNTTLMSLVRDKLAIARTYFEAKHAIKQGAIEVNGKIVKDEKYSMGFGDTIHIIPTDEYYSVGINKQSAIALEKVGADTKRILKVVGKYVAKGQKLMLKLYDGSVINADKAAGVNDSVIVTDRKISSAIKFEKGAKCVVFRGAHAGESGVIKSFTASTRFSKAEVRIEDHGTEFETLLDNVIVIGATNA